MCVYLYIYTHVKREGGRGSSELPLVLASLMETVIDGSACFRVAAKALLIVIRSSN